MRIVRVMLISSVIMRLRIYDRLTFSVSLSYFGVHSVEKSLAKKTGADVVSWRADLNQQM